MTLPDVRECTLFSSDLRTRQLVATASAALGLETLYERALPERYPDRGLLLIATDLTPLSIPTRPGVLLLDLDATTTSSSGALVGIAGDDREAATNLANRIGTLVVSAPSSRLVSITTSGGGIGLTTLVALVGLAAARTNQKTLLIDQSDRLLRIIGARSASIDYGLQPVQPPKVGVLAPDVIVTPTLLLEARTRFDSVILGIGDSASVGGETTHCLHLSANTALAVEQSAVWLDGANPRSVQIVLRQLSYGSLSMRQVAAALRSRQIVEWPEDSNLALAADLGDLAKANRAIERARRLWSNLTEGSVDRGN